MSEKIKKVLVCGIGAIGSIYAEKIQKFVSADLKVLLDKSRFERYINNPVIFNGNALVLDYILPENTEFKADLIIIATKFDGLEDAVINIKNFVKEDTVIVSLLNGVTSERIIAEHYGWEKILLSYYIGHSAVRDGRNVTFDGVGKIVFGAKSGSNDNVIKLKEFFDNAEIDYEISEEMEYSLWLKFMFNVAANQLSAVLNMTFGEMKKNVKFLETAEKMMREVQCIAKAEGILHTDKMVDDAMESFSKMCDEGKTSMLQDVLAKRKTEVDMFAGTVIELGKKHNIATPYNCLIKSMIEIIQQNY